MKSVTMENLNITKIGLIFFIRVLNKENQAYFTTIQIVSLLIRVKYALAVYFVKLAINISLI